MEKGKISVIVPVYNGAAWLETCVDSILVQSRRDLEVLIVDERSTDGTDRAAKRLEQRDKRVRYAVCGKKGVSAARNQGIGEAHGEFLTFVDADDRIEKRLLELLAKGLEETGADLAACDFLTWNGKEQSPSGPAGTDISEDGLKLYGREGWLSDCLLHGVTRCWGILYRRAFVGDTRFREDLSIGEDMMFLMDLLPKLDRAARLSYPGYFYRVNQNGAMLRPFTPSYMDEIRSWRLAAEMIEREYPGNRARVNGILAVSAMLAAGKLSALSGRERDRYGDCVKECRDTVRKALQTPGARAQLPGGYRLKTALFLMSPALYMGLYHLWKKG